MLLLVCFSLLSSCHETARSTRYLTNLPSFRNFLCLVTLIMHKQFLHENKHIVLHRQRVNIKSFSFNWLKELSSQHSQKNAVRTATANKRS